MKKDSFQNVWLIFVRIKAKSGFNFNELIDIEKENKDVIFQGAWANLLVKSNTINEALKLVPLGLNELNFEVDFIDKIENVASLIENKELNKIVLKEASWLIKSEFVFKISGDLFPHV